MEVLAAPMRDTAPPVAPQAPEAGWARRLLGPFYVTGIFWYRFHCWAIGALPPWVMAIITVLFTSFFFVALRNIRAAIAANLEPVLGPCGWLERQLRIFRTMWSFAWCLSERYERLSTNRRFKVRSDGFDHWRALNASGKGFILVTAHIGNWQVGSMVPAEEEQRKVHVVREAETDPRAQRFVADMIRNASCGNYATHFAEDPQLGVILLEALRQGEIVALQGDRPRAGGKTVEATLLGRSYPLPLGPLAMARAAEVPILPVFFFREGRLSYRCAIRPPIHVPRSRDRQADVEEAAQHLAADLQWAITHQPHQWFCFGKAWRERREESAFRQEERADRAA